MQPIEIYQHAGLTVEIHQDDDPSSPREWCNLGTMIFCPRDRNRLHLHEGGNDDDDIPAIIAEPGTVYVTLYETNDGVAAEDCPYAPSLYDSPAGIAYVTREQWQREYKRQRLTKQLRATIVRLLIGEARDYSDYCEGNVYGYVIRDPETDEELDSLWGMYEGDDPSYTTTTANAAAEAIAKERDQDAKELADAYAIASATFDAADLIGAAS